MRLTINDEDFENILNSLDDEKAKKKLIEAKEKWEKSITDKLKKSTKTANEVKVKRSKEKVENAIKILKMENKKINPNTIAKTANISYPTAKKYLEELKKNSLIEI